MEGIDMDMLQELVELGKKYTILYVEDDKPLQTETQKVLQRIFHNVLVADNGQEGYQLFSDEQIDLVLTDIEMPIMNGLKMSEQIKEISPECPIVVLSAYSGSDYLIEAIENSVDHYVLKPINAKKLLETLYKVCQRLEDKRLVKEYKQQQIQQQIIEEKQDMLSQVSNCSPNPMLVYNNGKLSFINHAFETLFDHDDLETQIHSEEALEAFLNNHFAQDDILKNHEEITMPFSIGSLDTKDRKIALKTKEGKKFFLILKSHFNLKDETDASLYTMNDITELLYQQVQLELYSKNLSSAIEDNFVRRQPKNEGIINKVDF